MKKINKKVIEELGNKVVALCKKNDWTSTVVYFNGKSVNIRYDGAIILKDDDHPGNHFEYYNPNHIVSMSFEGDLYDLLNYGYGKELRKLFEEYRLYFELGNAWNLSVYPMDDDLVVDGYRYKEKLEPKIIARWMEDVPAELKNIMDWWYEKSTETGDVGSCVIGAGFNLVYGGVPYFMCACSPWQGNISWETHVDEVRQMLRDIGATDVYFDYGTMD